MPTLSDTLYDTILTMSNHADSKLLRGECAQAAQMYMQALHLLPKPIEQWEAATWLSGRAVDALFKDRKYAEALTEMRQTMRMPGALENPFIRLRYGQLLFEAGDFAHAKQELLVAYTTEGATIFEEDNPKYLEFIKDMIEAIR